LALPPSLTTSWWKVTGSRIISGLVDRRLNTEARSDVVSARLVSNSDRVRAIDLGHLGKRLIDEDDRDENSEALLREASDVANQEA